MAFSDEKKFNLDGPDCWRSYSRPRKRVLRNKGQRGGGFLMLWGMLPPGGVQNAKRIIGTQTSKEYRYMFSTFAVHCMRNVLNHNFIFQQNNCSTHVSKHITNYFEEVCFELLKWPSRNPDLNIIENV